MMACRINLKTLFCLFSVLLLTFAVGAEPAGSKASFEKEPSISSVTAGSYSGATADVDSPAKTDQIRKNDLLQFTAGGHVLGFRPGAMYLAAADHALKIEFVGARPVAPVVQTESSSTSDISQAVKPLEAVTYPDLWDGISLVYEKGAGGFVKSTYRVAKGTRHSQVNQIRLAYNVPVQLDDSGRLMLTFKTGQLRESAPIAWQEKAGKRIPVDVAFRVISAKEIGFSVGAYDSTLPLVIDPELSWNTFMGSASNDGSLRIAVDGSGNVYIAGYSQSTWGTPVNPHAGGGNYDAFVAKLDGSGVLQWNTFMGSTDIDYSRGIAVDGSGNVYVTGTSDSTWGSPVNAHAGGGRNDAFAAKLNSSGTLQWNTFMGSTDYDFGWGIAVNGSGNVYVGGMSDSTWGSPLSAFAGVRDVFAAKLNSIGQLQWHTFMGSGNVDSCTTLSIDSSGNLYVIGSSAATWGTPVNAHGGGWEAFAAQLDSSGVLQWNTFMGTADYDYGSGIAVDNSGNVYVSGYSRAGWGSPVNPHAGGGNYDAFAAKLNSSGALQWNTFMGSTSIDYGYGIAVDNSGTSMCRDTAKLPGDRRITLIPGGVYMMALPPN